MRLFVYAVLSVAFAAAASAQRGGGHAGGGGRAGGGMTRGGGGFARGGVGSGFRGGSIAGGLRGGLSYGGLGRGGTYRGNYGFRGYGRGRYFGRSYFYYGSPYGYGYWDPFFWDDWNDYYPSQASYGYPYSSSYQPAPDITVVSNYGVPQPPPMVMAAPPEPPAPNATSGANSAEPTLYLIAFNDHNIKPVLAYWWDKGTLHYVTMDRVEKTAPLATVDRDMSLRLNEERNVTFSLPNPPPSSLKG